MKKPRQAKLTRSFLIRRSEYRLGLANQFFFDSSSFTGQIAQVVEFGAADVTVALNFDAGNQRRIELECTFHTFTAGILRTVKAEFKPRLRMAMITPSKA